MDSLTTVPGYTVLRVHVRNDGPAVPRLPAGDATDGLQSMVLDVAGTETTRSARIKCLSRSAGQPLSGKLFGRLVPLSLILGHLGHFWHGCGHLSAKTAGLERGTEPDSPTPLFRKPSRALSSFQAHQVRISMRTSEVGAFDLAGKVMIRLRDRFRHIPTPSSYLNEVWISVSGVDHVLLPPLDTQLCPLIPLWIHFLRCCGFFKVCAALH